MDPKQTRRDFLCAGAGALALPGLASILPRYEDVPAAAAYDGADSWMRIHRVIRQGDVNGVGHYSRTIGFQLFAWHYNRPATWNAEARMYFNARHASFWAIVDRPSADAWLKDIGWPERLFTTRMGIDLGGLRDDPAAVDFSVFGARFDWCAEDVLVEGGIPAKKLYFSCANSTILKPTGREVISDPGFRHDHGTI